MLFMKALIVFIISLKTINANEFRIKEIYREKNDYSHKYIQLNIRGQISNNLEDVIDISSEKDNDILANFIRNNYGSDYFASPKISLFNKLFDTTIGFETKGFISLGINNPIFPEIEGEVLHEYNILISKKFKYNNFNIRPVLRLGRRKYFQTTIMASDILNKTIEADLNSADYQGFSMLDLLVNYKYKKHLIEFNSYALPLSGYNPIKSQAIQAIHKYSIKNNLKSNLSIIPFYIGNYDFKRTIRWGIDYNIFNRFTISPYFNYDLPSISLNSDFKYFKINTQIDQQYISDVMKSKDTHYILNFIMQF